MKKPILAAVMVIMLPWMEMPPEKASTVLFGGLNTTLKDMAAFLKAKMGIVSTRLRAALNLAQQVHFENYQGPGWHQASLPDGQTITFHSGVSAGNQTFIGFNRDYAIGAVVLDNVVRSQRLAWEIGRNYKIHINIVSIGSA